MSQSFAQFGKTLTLKKNGKPVTKKPFYFSWWLAVTSPSTFEGPGFVTTNGERCTKTSLLTSGNLY